MTSLPELPVSGNLDFMTLSVVVPVMIYEAKREWL